MSGTLIQIVPGLEPYGGVASHARTLARALEEQAALRTRFVAPRHDGADAAERLHRELASGDGAPVLLHYSNYGYDRRGCPRWLLAALEHWRQQRPNARLVTVFHEVYATGRPWQSSFWLSPVQRRLAARLRRLSDHAVTSLELYRDLLRQWNDGEVVTLPVFSTVGEPPAPAALGRRRRRLVVFGSPGLRARAYTSARRELQRACAALEVEEIADAGPAIALPATFAGIPVRRLGEQPAEAISDLLADSVAGFLSYPPALVAKSTVFAAYAAHRMVPVCAWPNGRPSNAAGVDDGHERLWDGTRRRAEWQQIADAAHAWYQGHPLARHTAAYAELLR
ncbi:MAG TPA: glycosyltransferase family 1 protein [Thermoanaerobaculia bacterium]|nr:glycosyltransferase family 1 protein [Thermoanaerobaculia bacterium]